MREITKRLKQMSNKLGYEGREEERKAIIKEHLTKCLEVLDLTLQDIAKEPDLIYEHYIFNQWMIYTYDIYLFFNIDILYIVNDFIREYGEITQEIIYYELLDNYAHRIIFEDIDQWAEEEKKGVANV
jgi:hypothetical protein